MSYLCVYLDGTAPGCQLTYLGKRKRKLKQIEKLLKQGRCT